jgi:hypothetical protein
VTITPTVFVCNGLAAETYETHLRTLRGDAKLKSEPGGQSSIRWKLLARSRLSTKVPKMPYSYFAGLWVEPQDSRCSCSVSSTTQLVNLRSLKPDATKSLDSRSLIGCQQMSLQPHSQHHERVSRWRLHKYKYSLLASLILPFYISFSE